MIMSDKIYIGIDDKRIEAKGEQLDYILQAQAEATEQARLIEAEQQAKEAAKASAMNKLSALGLTDEEISALIQ
jgi:wobble nucleotide-excising tRNase